MKEQDYWLWLTGIKGFGNKKIKILLESYFKPKDIFEADEKDIKQIMSVYPFDKNDYSEFRASKDLAVIEKLSKNMEDNQINVITIDSNNYPSRLKSIYDPPFVIFYKGRIIPESKVSIGIVGARKCTAYGAVIAKDFGARLAEKGVSIVSGMALGIDAQAHWGALENGGYSVAVMGCGVNICYPPENNRLWSELIKKGTIISEFAINEQPSKGHFPKRNRIISGLCDGILVVEAKERSGSLITVDNALEQGRDVFAVPGKIQEQLSKGTNNLIKMGAKLVTCADDILEEYEDRFFLTTKTSSHISLKFEEREKQLYNIIQWEPIDYESLINKAKMPIDEISYLLIKLELKGAVKQLPNRYFIRVI